MMGLFGDQLGRAGHNVSLFVSTVKQCQAGFAMSQWHGKQQPTQSGVEWGDDDFAVRDRRGPGGGSGNYGRV
jgi:hypothetical protein